MTYAQIYTEVQNLAFDASVLSSIKNWVRAREAEVWQYAEWPIKQQSAVNISVSAGTATISLPAAMTFTSQALQIFDNYGTELEYMDEDDFFDVFQPYAVGTASTVVTTPTAWTLTSTNSAGVITPEIRLGPVPGASATFTIRGWHLPVCRSGATAWKLGTMSADTDLPWWPDDYHYFLVPGAIALGGKLLNSLDWQSQEQDFQSGLQRLKAEIMPDDRSTIEQWGSDYGEANRTWSGGRAIL